MPRFPTSPTILGVLLTDDENASVIFSLRSDDNLCIVNNPRYYPVIMAKSTY